MEEDVVVMFVPIVSVIVVGLILTSFFYFRYKSRMGMQQTIQRAIDKGNELTPELLDRLAGPRPTAAHDLRLALVWIAVGTAFVLFGAILDEEEAFRALAAIGMFPLLIGTAYLIIWKIGARGA